MNEKAEKLLGYLRAFDDPTLVTFTPDPEGINLLLRNIPAAVFVRDVQSGQIMFMNDQAADLFGITMNDAVGKTLADSGMGITPEGKAGLSGAVRAVLRDVAGARVKVMVFSRKVEIRGKTAEIVLVVDSTLFRGEGGNDTETGLTVFRRALVESGTAYIFTEMAGSSIERDMIVLETQGALPSFLQGKVKPGCSISELFPPVEAARLVETAISLSSEQGAKNLELRGDVDVRLISGGGNRAMLTFPSRRDREVPSDRVQARTGKLSATIRRTVLSIDPSGDSTAEGMLRMLGFTAVSVDSVASGLILLEETPERFLFVLLEQENPPEFRGLVDILMKTNTGLVVVSSRETPPDTPEGLKFAQVPAPLGINSLASAVSLVC